MIMHVHLDPEHEKQLRAAAEAAGIDPGELAKRFLEEALARRARLLEHIDEGTRHLRDGEVNDYDGKGLERYFASVQRLGRERHEARKNAE